MKNRYGDARVRKYPLCIRKRMDLATRIARAGISHKTSRLAEIDSVLNAISMCVGGDAPVSRWNRRCFMMERWCKGPFMYVDTNSTGNDTMPYDPSNPFPAVVGMSMERGTGRSAYRTRVVRDFQELDDAAFELLEAWMKIDAGSLEGMPIRMPATPTDTTNAGSI
jgi:hypothetical protein